jgi:hypothetical protein
MILFLVILGWILCAILLFILCVCIEKVRKELVNDMTKSYNGSTLCLILGMIFGPIGLAIVLILIIVNISLTKGTNLILTIDKIFSMFDETKEEKG